MRWLQKADSLESVSGNSNVFLVCIVRNNHFPMQGFDMRRDSVLTQDGAFPVRCALFSKLRVRLEDEWKASAPMSGMGTHVCRNINPLGLHYSIEVC
ncbi:hypothetical protein CEXT_709171 [Caerostris extrusa]|uniref:Uncharacterized protein n=1 Tax=Caerostris extrusa TaxID=172846 RepID=A0AAV4YEP6_CAEEX|nr:hypothetical protein CEXT_709171 [Caerostris extrusa]